MASLYITEYGSVGSERTPIAQSPRVAMQKLTVGAETKSAAFQPSTRFIRVHTDAICSIVISTAPTATTSDSRMAAGDTEYFGVNPGDKLSVISNT
jgi:hypothetical protein